MIAPEHGPMAGGTTVTITGEHFLGVQTVTFGGFVTSFAADSDVQITAVSPPRSAAGSVVLTVTGPEGAASAWFIYYP
jgi:hypothetical protein